MNRLRVLTLNIWNRMGPWERRLPMIREGIRRLDPDLVGLQEVIDHQGRTQADEIREGLGYEAAFGAAHDIGGGLRFGNAVLSRWPIPLSRVFPLPVLDSGEHRSLLLAEIASPERARRPTGVYTRPVGASPAAPGSSLVVDVSPREDEPELAAAKAKLLSSTRRYEDLLDRVDAARIELITAQAAFKYRYTVVEPPEVPRDPKGLKGYLLAAGGIVLSVFLAIFAAAAKDLGSGRFIEAWQVRRRLGIPVLAEVDKP